MALFDLLTNAPRDREALRHGAERWTYDALAAASLRIGGAFVARGLARGDRVAFFQPNGPELVLSYFGCFAAGLVAVPLNPRYAMPEVAHAVAGCRPRLLIAHRDLLDRIDGARLAALGVEDVFVVGGAAPAGARAFSDLTGAPPLARPSRVLDDDDAVVLYTSGSTGSPKGVTHTHASLGQTARHQIVSQRLDRDDVQLAWMGIAYIAGFAGQLLTSLALGGRLVLLREFDPEAVLAAIAAQRATRLQTGPTDLRDLLDHPATTAADLSSLRCCLAGGEQIQPDLHRRWEERTGFALTEGCGMTEAYFYALAPPFGPKRTGSIGLPTDGAEIRLVDAGGVDAAEGEILVRSDAVMRGYWNDPGATADAMRDGWLVTGDLARRDGDGWYWFVGRRKQIIIRGASNIAPGEVESVLAAHPEIASVAVVGAPDRREGHVPVAFVQLRPGASTTPVELRAFAGERLAAYKVPTRITVVDSLPRNATGKVDRSTLTARASSNEEDGPDVR